MKVKKSPSLPIIMVIISIYIVGQWHEILLDFFRFWCGGLFLVGTDACRKRNIGLLPGIFGYGIFEVGCLRRMVDV